MRKIIMALLVLAALAASAAAQGVYTGHITSGSDGKNRSVVIINTVTGDFEVYDIDNRGLNRRENRVYYDCVSYNRAEGTREVREILINE
ncbi:MAG TPA: hypothetical protein ENN43_00175 [bacterium]|nr:hypothetical protein [bacterium]